MGVCFDCLVTIDGTANRQGCMTMVRDGMRIETQRGKRDIRRMILAADDLRDRYDVAVVGAGPAGLAAASFVCAAGLGCVLFDEQQNPGGQIYRGVTSSPFARNAVLGDDYWRGEAMVRDALASGAHYVAGATVWGLLRPGRDRGFGRRHQRGRFAPPALSWRPARSSGHSRSQAGRCLV